MVELSIVMGTYNRFDRLRSCVESIEKYVSRSFEIIISDGGSTDGTREWASERDGIILVGKRSLDGAVDAYNAAFSIASAPLVAHLNDDVELMGSCLDAACDILDGDDTVGQVAIPFIDGHGDPVINYIHCNGQKVLYANFGVTRRVVGDAVGWWGNYLYTYGGDCELSFNIWDLGLRVVPLSGYALHHYREQDELRIDNTESRKFFDKWRNFKLTGRQNED
jgi:glycosyltransferase involved in cell wall biosynthesis